MKAVLCKQLGLPETLVVEDVPSPKPGPGQVVVSVKAAGVNFPDVLIIQGKYQFKPEPPFSPGGEVAGVIKALGEGLLANEVDSWMTGINSNVEGKQTRIVARYSGSAPAYRHRSLSRSRGAA